MKKLILALVLCLPEIGAAQQIILKEEMVVTRDVPVNAYITNATDDFDEVISNYKKFVKDEYKLNVKKENSTTYVIEAADMPQISVKRGDLKVYLLHTDTMNLMAFSFVLGYDIFLNTEDYPEEMGQFRKFVIRFIDYHYQAYYSDAIEAVTKDLDALKKDLKQNEDKINALRKKVNSLDKKVSKEKEETKKIQYQSDVLLTESEIKNLLFELPEQRIQVNEKEQELFKLKEEVNKYHQLISTI